MNRVRPSPLLAPLLLIVLMLLSGCAGLTGEPQHVLRIDGVSTLIDATQMPFVFIKSEGGTSLTDNPHFRMDEWIVPTPILFWNSDGFTPNFGVISIPGTAPESGSVCIGFAGWSLNRAVKGVFRAIETLDQCPPPLAPVYWTIDGTFAGNADVCELSCTPLLDPECPREVEGPACTGFTVQFDFY